MASQRDARWYLQHDHQYRMVSGRPGLLPATAITWSAAMVPSSFWTGWLSRSPAACAAGVMTCALTFSADYFVQLVWPPLRQYTFVTVDLMLHVLGLTVVSDPSQAILGTERFAVRVAPACSGLQGIVLISAFIAAYLWIYRSDYRFPAALVLFPVGIASSWLLNAVRITALIIIGQWDESAAVPAFIRSAGWIFFNLTAFGLVCASRRVRWITPGDEAARALSARQQLILERRICCHFYSQSLRQC